MISRRLKHWGLLTTSALLFATSIAADDSKTFTEVLQGPTLVKFDMIRIPAGKLKTDKGEIDIKSLWLEKTETTWDEYDIFCYQLDLTDKEKATGVDAAARPSKPYGAPDFGFGHTHYPCLAATYHSAQMYCQWLSKKTGHKYRLPTEYEWEYACRAGAEAPAGDKLDEYAWYWDNSDDKTHAVMKKKPNAWGFYDMLGNALEWCTKADNTGGIGCGGAWDDKPEDISPSKRREQDRTWNSTDPQQPKSKWWLSDGKFVGFRVVRED